jgi:hypothetical protein
VVVGLVVISIGNLFLQSGPKNPGEHIHMAVSPDEAHTPLFQHGFWRQGLSK